MMWRWYCQLLLPAMVCLLLFSISAGIVAELSVQRTSDEYARQYMRGVTQLLAERLQQQPQHDWPQLLMELERHFPFELHLVNSVVNAGAGAGPLTHSADNWQDYSHWVAASDEQIHLPLPNSPYLLAVGPAKPWLNDAFGLPLPYISAWDVLFWAILSLLFAAVLLWWLRPLKLDIDRLKGLALDWGKGLKQPAPAMSTRLFQPLADTYHAMTDRIEQLLSTQTVLARALSHELRTPIARLRFSLEILALESCHTEAARHCLDAMDEELSLLGRLVDASISYARYETAADPLQLEEIVLEPWLEEQLAWELRDPHVTVSRVGLEGQTCAAVDAELLGLAVRNVLRNACRYAQSRIELSFSASTSGLQIQISDDGPGIPRRDRQRIFEPFIRLAVGAEDKASGFGLGLAISKRIMQWHGGDIEAGRSAQGGALFTLCLPAN